MKFAGLVVLLATLLASGCIVVSKRESLAPDEQTARDLKQQQSAQEVSRMANLQTRMLEASNRNFDRERQRAAPRRLGGD